MLFVLFLPYVITLLLSGRQGVGRQEKLPEREYEVLEMMLSEDLSWMGCINTSAVGGTEADGGSPAAGIGSLYRTGFAETIRRTL